ncbi:hypothetical protein GCM10025876_14540 [Demequina litorisediminis]|uniref:Uncharacterized protein n=1 Tax=Demequina litorisediminis TaxID=1849022 RepID=A0ABQ6ID13_9MICO|nr:hypothetical protein GCM10025876_14540 [Demequina litorisediminis]
MSYESVETVMRRVADELIRPRFRALSEGDIDTKSGPHDLVTIADVESEKALTPCCARLMTSPWWARRQPSTTPR